MNLSIILRMYVHIYALVILKLVIPDLLLSILHQFVPNFKDFLLLFGIKNDPTIVNCMILKLLDHYQLFIQEINDVPAL